MWTAVVHARPCAARSSVFDPPVADLVEIDVERGLVELDDVDAGGLDRARLVVQDFGERPRELFAAPVVGIVEGVDHRHRAGQRDLDLAVGRAAQEARGVDEHRMPARDRTDDDGNVGVVAVADAHGLPVLEVDAVEALEKRRHEMPARLLAVGDDVDAGLAPGRGAPGGPRPASPRRARRLRAARAPRALSARPATAGLGRLPAIVVCRSLVIADSARGVGVPRVGEGRL